MHRPTTLTALASLFIGVLPLIASGCADSDGDGGLRSASLSGGARSAAQPEDVARDFFEAARDNDEERLSSTLTEKARAGMSSGQGFDLNGDSLGEFQIGRVQRSESEADVPVTVVLDGEETTMKLRMRHEASAWRVWGVDVQFGDDELTFDFETIDDMMQAVGDELGNALGEAFEDAFAEMSMGGSPEDIRAARTAFEATTPISSADFDAGWRIDVDCDDAPANDVLGGLLADTGLALADDSARALENGVSLKLEGVSRLEAIERICEQLDLHVVYPTSSWGVEGPEMGTLSVEAGKRVGPVTFAGPFLVEVSALEENVPHTTGEVTLTVRALGIPAAAMPLATEMIELASVESIVDVRGKNLNADDGVSFMGQPEIEGSYLSTNLSLDLKGLLRDVETMTISGSVLLSFPSTVQDLRWTQRDDEARKVGPYAVELEGWSESTQFSVRATGDLDALQVRLSATDAAQQPLGTLYTDSSNWGDRVNASIQTNAAPAAVDLKICRLEQIAFAFELPGVTLARHAEMPAQLEPLRFDGAAPIAVEFVRFTKRDEQFPEVELSIASTANKNVESAVTTFFYDDAQGRQLEDFPHTLTGEFSFEGQAPLVAPRSTTKQNVTAFFMPAETKRIRIRVQEVTFVDASKWVLEE